MEYNAETQSHIRESREPRTVYDVLHIRNTNIHS